MPYLKHGRPIGSKDTNSQKINRMNNKNDHDIMTISQKDLRDVINNKTVEEVQIPKINENKEILTSYVSTINGMVFFFSLCIG